MLINCSYPERITWMLNLLNISDPLELFGKKTQKKLRSALSKLKSSDYCFMIEKVDRAYIEKFSPIYEDNVKKKKNPNVHNLMYELIENPPNTFPFFALSLYENDVLRGGLIFSDRGSHIVVSFRVFPQNIELKLPLSISYVAEFHLNEFALKNKKTHIQRGRDRNLFGVNAAIGLAHFKLLCSYEPYMINEATFERKNFKLVDGYDWNGQDTVLIFETAPYEARIHEAILLVAESDRNIVEEKYPSLFNSQIINLKRIDFAP